MLADPQPIMIHKKRGRSVKPRPRKREESQSFSDIEDTLENMNQLSHHAVTRTKPEDTTIEDYISKKSQPNFQDTLPTSVLCRVATSKAVDKAYSYLFKQLKGQCHGLNVVIYPRISKDDKPREPADDLPDTEEIEKDLVRIFKDAAEKKAGGEEAKWRLEGVVFELWAIAPIAWDLRSGHL
ncbi:hypothetical protein TMatcc_006464 [Talaromyces marneffei ATCC 18224]|uniref:Uncharacterized protein n=1 Tax=Talaromyces marneffei (strain ATCC 18224 / CBS 334.59 / QM 7333) TaxID=441960 RepID=B6QAQ3_TALMQ|nr:hypothetical protein PMAA_064260 [Talaromyces marneffei ATCC 18224]